MASISQRRFSVFHHQRYLIVFSMQHYYVLMHICALTMHYSNLCPQIQIVKPWVIYENPLGRETSDLQVLHSRNRRFTKSWFEISSKYALLKSRLPRTCSNLNSTLNINNIQMGQRLPKLNDKYIYFND